MLDMLEDKVRSRIFGLLSFLVSKVAVLLIFDLDLPIRFGDLDLPAGDDFLLGDLPGDDLRRGDFDGEDFLRGETFFFLTSLPLACCCST